MKRLFNAPSGVVGSLLLTALLACQPLDTDAPETTVDWAEEIAYQRGIQAMVWAMPAVSIMDLRDAHFSLGGGYNTVYTISEVPTALQEALTPNNQTPYASVFLDTRDGPVVLDVPPATDRTALFGSAVDVFQVPVADVGPAGTDAGRGGRYLFVPPDFDGTVPDGFFPVHLDTYSVFIALRPIPLGDATFAEAARYSEQLNAYPLARADDPPAGTYIDIAGQHVPTLPTYDLPFFERIAQLVDTEPVLRDDAVMRGMLASIGIERGRAFEPDETLRAALQRAAADGKRYLDYTFVTPSYSLEGYWEGRQWQVPRQPSEEGFVFDEGPYLLLDERGSIFHWATYIPRRLGAASAYLAGLRDAEGALLDGSFRYRLTVPAEVPARDFWSVIAYSMDTKAFIYNDLGRVGLSSYDLESMTTSEDGSVDIYFGPSAPDGLESNWIPTGEDFFLLFRLYGPEPAFFDRSFVLPDVERVR
jgi:hypothetical protein